MLEYCRIVASAESERYPAPQNVLSLRDRRVFISAKLVAEIREIRI